MTYYSELEFDEVWLCGVKWIFVLKEKGGGDIIPESKRYDTKEEAETEGKKAAEKLNKILKEYSITL